MLTRAEAFFFHLTLLLWFRKAWFLEKSLPERQVLTRLIHHGSFQVSVTVHGGEDSPLQAQRTQRKHREENENK